LYCRVCCVEDVNNVPKLYILYLVIVYDFTARDAMAVPG
jgi:hypothetical protein